MRRARRKLKAKAAKEQHSTPGISEFCERVGDAAWQRRLTWLGRPRLHTAIFEAAWRDEESAKECTSRGIVMVDKELFELLRTEQAQKIEALTKTFEWSDERLALFKKLVVQFRRDHSIENYVLIRRQFPELEIQVGQFAGIDALFALEDDFKKAGIDPRLVAAALDADEPSVDALCLRLMELLIAKRKLPTCGPGYIAKRRSAISDTMVNYLIAVMLEVFDWRDELFRVPASFVLLVRHQLCGLKPDLHEDVLSKKKRRDAAYDVGANLKPGERLSINKIAKMARVPRSTAARWLDNKDFQLSVETGREWAAEGVFARAFEAQKERLKKK
jgi:hypothetical protein